MNPSKKRERIKRDDFFLADAAGNQFAPDRNDAQFTTLLEVDPLPASIKKFVDVQPSAEL